MNRAEIQSVLEEYGYSREELRGMSLEDMETELDSFRADPDFHPNESEDEFWEHGDEDI